VFVVMAVYRPDLTFLQEQVRSILDQSEANVTLVSVLDGADPAVETALASFADHRVVVIPTSRLGIVGAFELGLRTALSMSESEGDRFAFADQDDVWESRKLGVLTSALDPPNCDLAFSDARVIDASDALLADSLVLAEERLPRPGLGDLLVANSVSGMTMVFTKRVARLSLPFPRIEGSAVLHDWWVTIVASSLAPVRFVPEPLVRHRLHGANAIGPRLTPGRSASEKRKRSFLDRSIRHYLIRKALAEETERALRTAGLSCPAPLTLIGRNGISASFFFAGQAIRSILRGRSRLAMIAWETAVGGLIAPKRQ
jgi:glycosyltransferase involved in cell wall biosynthesis